MWPNESRIPEQHPGFPPSQSILAERNTSDIRWGTLLRSSLARCRLYGSVGPIWLQPLSRLGRDPLRCSAKRPSGSESLNTPYCRGTKQVASAPGIVFWYNNSTSGGLGPKAAHANRSGGTLKFQTTDGRPVMDTSALDLVVAESYFPRGCKGRCENRGIKPESREHGNNPFLLCCLCATRTCLQPRSSHSSMFLFPAGVTVTSS